MTRYNLRKINAARQRGRDMARRRWELDRLRREQQAVRPVEHLVGRIVRRIVVIENEATVRECVFLDVDSQRTCKRKLRQVLAGGSPA